MQRKTFIGAVAPTLLLTLMLGNSAQAENDTLKIGVYVPYMPFQFKKPDGTIAGFEVDLVNAACERMQRHCEWVEQPWNGIIPAGKAVQTYTIPVGGTYHVVCDVHPWMRAAAAVVSHPCFSKTDGEGQFTIEGLPPGDHVLEVWHERLGTKRISVTVSSGEEVTIPDVVYSAP